MDGGLGNQLFQYIFFRFLEEKTGDICYVDDRAFFQCDEHNGYALDKIFGLQPNLLSGYFDKDVYDAVLKITKEDINIVDFLSGNGLPLQVLSYNDLIRSQTMKLRHPYKGHVHNLDARRPAASATRLAGNVYYYGYWICHDYFLNIRDKILGEVRFPAIDDEYNRGIAAEISRKQSVGVHVRRGDFISRGWQLSADWYCESVVKINNAVSDPVFFIFSDDMEWCRSNIETLGFNAGDVIVYVEGNSGGTSFRDMQHMTSCKHLIIANSTFSFIAALLNQNPNKLVLNPLPNRIVV